MVTKLPSYPKRSIVLFLILVGAAAYIASISPFFVFGLVTVVKIAAYLGLMLWAERQRPIPKRAARSLAMLNLFACVATFEQLLQSNTHYRFYAFAFLIAAFAFEARSVVGWYTKWVFYEQRLSDDYDDLTRKPGSKRGSLITAFVWIILQNVAFGFMWV